ncbi:hypothetical protein D3C81_1791450 [compost metagenome]
MFKTLGAVPSIFLLSCQVVLVLGISYSEGMFKAFLTALCCVTIHFLMKMVGFYR